MPQGTGLPDTPPSNWHVDIPFASLISAAAALCSATAAAATSRMPPCRPVHHQTMMWTDCGKPFSAISPPTSLLSCSQNAATSASMPTMMPPAQQRCRSASVMRSMSFGAARSSTCFTRNQGCILSDAAQHMRLCLEQLLLPPVPQLQPLLSIASPLPLLLLLLLLLLLPTSAPTAQTAGPLGLV